MSVRLLIAVVLIGASAQAVEVESAWSRTYGGANSEEAHNSELIDVTDDGGYLLAGTTASFGTEGTGKNIWVLRLNASGEVVWEKVFGGASIEGVNSVRQTRDGGCAVAGYTYSFGHSCPKQPS